MYADPDITLVNASASDAELKIMFVVTNPTGSAVRVSVEPPKPLQLVTLCWLIQMLKRQTPLEGMISEMFVVKNAG